MVGMVGSVTHIEHHQHQHQTQVMAPRCPWSRCLWGPAKTKQVRTTNSKEKRTTTRLTVKMVRMCLGNNIWFIIQYHS